MKAILTLTAAMAFAISPFTTSGFGGFDARQFPVPQIDPPVEPAGFAFSIWALLYVWLLAGALFGLLKRDTAPGWDAPRWPLIASLVLGAAWIPVAQFSPLWATLMIWAMWGTAVAALLRAGPEDRLWLRTPLALYAGWLTAAACVALALMLAGHAVMSAQAAAIVMIGVALILAAGLLAARRDAPELALAVGWALAGIIAANMTPLNLPVVALAGTGLAALAAVALRHRPRAAA